MILCDACGKAYIEARDIDPVHDEFATKTFQHICKLCSTETGDILRHLANSHREQQQKEGKEAIANWLFQKQSTQ